MDTYFRIPAHDENPILPNSLALFVTPRDSSPEEIDTLDNIIKACGLLQGQGCQTVFVEPTATLASASLPATVQYIVCFGLRPLDLGLVAAVVPYQWTPAIGGRKYCFAERLSAIAADMERKKRLWATVKTLKASLSPAP